MLKFDSFRIRESSIQHSIAGGAFHGAESTDKLLSLKEDRAKRWPTLREKESPALSEHSDVHMRVLLLTKS